MLDTQFWNLLQCLTYAPAEPATCAPQARMLGGSYTPRRASSRLGALQAISFAALIVSCVRTCRTLPDLPLRLELTGPGLGAIHVLVPQTSNGAEAPKAKAKSSPAKKAEERPMLQRKDGRFIDYRWQEGRWVLSEFANEKTGEMDWPAWNSVRA